MNSIAKKILGLLLCVLLCFGALNAMAEEPTAAQALMNDVVIGWSLGNTLDSFSVAKLGGEGLKAETVWGNPKTTQELIDLVVDSGFNLIRVPVTWYTHMNENYEVDPAWMDRVQETVDYVMNTGAYCLLNVHHDTGDKGWLKASDKNLDEKKAMFTALWQQIAERFADYGDHLIFEGFNEILNDISSWNGSDPRALDITNELNQMFVDLVRSTGGNNPERVLVVNTYCAGGGNDVTRGFVLPQDTIEGHLIVSAHVYAPWSFCDGNQKSVKTWNPTDVDTPLMNLSDTFVKNGVPCIIGEFGAENKGNMNAILNWSKYYVDKCNELGLKCAWWDNGGLFMLFSRRSCTVYNEPLVNVLVGTAKGEDVMIEAEPEQADEKTGNLKPGTDLCADSEKWTAWIDTGSGAKANMSYTAKGFTVEVEKSGANAWFVQPTYRTLTLEQGATYKLSFDCYSDKEFTAGTYLQQNYGSYGSYAGLEYLIQNEENKVHVELEFTMDQNNDDNVALVFNLGGQQDLAPYTVTVSDVKLIKMEK